MSGQTRRNRYAMEHSTEEYKLDGTTALLKGAFAVLSLLKLD